LVVEEDSADHLRVDSVVEEVGEVAVHQQHEVVDVEDLAAVEVEVVVEIEEAEVHVVVEAVVEEVDEVVVAV